MAEEHAPGEDRLTIALKALSSPVRRAILRDLRAPKPLRAILVRPSRRDAGGIEAERPMARQTVQRHLADLLRADLVTARETVLEGQAVAEYVLNHQTLFALAEEFRELAKMRPREAFDTPTIPHVEGRAPHRIQGPCLVLVKGLDEGRAFPLRPAGEGRSEWVVGRRRNADVPLDYDPFVSSDNTLVVHEQGRYHVQDVAESRNGTKLNFQPLARGGRSPLEHGDLIGAGRSLLMFRA